VPTLTTSWGLPLTTSTILPQMSTMSHGNACITILTYLHIHTKCIIRVLLSFSTRTHIVAFNVSIVTCLCFEAFCYILLFDTNLCCCQLCMSHLLLVKLCFKALCFNSLFIANISHHFLCVHYCLPMCWSFLLHLVT
jgi:hypothetical protein